MESVRAERIKEIRKIPNEKSFELTVRNSHNFVCNDGFIKHNCDGCLIKLSKYNGEIHWFTNGSMDTNALVSARVIQIAETNFEPETKNCETFQDLIDFSVKKANAENWVNNIPNGTTYLFELTSPRTRIIVPYEKTELTLHGIYHHESTDPATWYEELPKEDSSPFPIPEKFNCKTLDETIKMLKDWKGDKEGIVICEMPTFKRVKIKTDFYLSLLFVKGGNNFSDESIFNAIQNGSIDDAVSAWQELAPRVDAIKQLVREVENFIDRVYNYGKKLKSETETKKDFALAIKDLPYKDILFEAYDGKTYTKDILKNKDISFQRFKNLVELKDNYLGG